jgi:hypothetical protein
VKLITVSGDANYLTLMNPYQYVSFSTHDRNRFGFADNLLLSPKKKNRQCPIHKVHFLIKKYSEEYTVELFCNKPLNKVTCT